MKGAEKNGRAEGRKEVKGDEVRSTYALREGDERDGVFNSLMA